MENSVDPYHVEWLHGRYGSFLRGESLPVVTKKHVKVAFEVFEHGILKRRVLEGRTEEDDDWKVGHPLVFPHMLRVGAAGLATFQIRVPIDDENTWHVWYQTYRPDGGAPPQHEIPVSSAADGRAGGGGALVAGRTASGDGRRRSRWGGKGAALSEDAAVTGRGLLLDLGGTAFGSGLERLALLGEREPAVRSIAARRGPLGPEPDPLWEAMLRGEITERGYWRARSDEVGAALGRPGWPITEFMHLLYGMVTDVLRPEAAALVTDAKAAGIRVGALTNDLAAFHGDAGMAGDPFIAGLDALVDGSVTGVLKPDPRAYAMAAEALGLPPSAIVFVDDMPWNAAAARDAGMVGLLLDLTDPAEVFERARKELGL